MIRALLRSLLVSLPAALVYLAALPCLALRLDRWLGLVWRLPPWIDALALGLIVAGGTLAAWSFWALTVQGLGTPNPLVPTTRVVEGGPFRRSRNPLMLGGWVLGAGLAILLRSATLMALVGLVATAGAVYVRRVEEPRMLARFGERWSAYVRRTPRWILLTVVLAGTLAAVPSVTHATPPAYETLPAIVVQIQGACEHAHPGAPRVHAEISRLGERAAGGAG